VIAVLILLAALFCPIFAGAGAYAEKIPAAPVKKTSADKIQVVRIEVEGLLEGISIPSGVIPSVPLLYDADAMKGTLYALSRFFSENGYPYNNITTLVISGDSVAVGNNNSTIAVSGKDDSPQTLTVRFIIDLDERVCNGPPLVVGVEKRVEMYHRDVCLRSGELFSSADVDETLRRLSMRPYVREVSAASPVIIEDAPRGADSLLAAVVPFTVAERRGMEVEGVLGYESGGGALSGRLDLSFMNLLRRGESAGVSYSGTDVFQRFKVSASQPWMFGLPIEAGGGAGLEIEDEGYGYFRGEFWTAVEINARWKCGVALNASETVPPDTVGDMYRFYGADVFISLIQMPFERGRTVREISAKVGTGAANREKSYTRNKMELVAGIHYPIFNEYALLGRVCANSLFTDEDYLPPAEQYRIGGRGSLRGYSDEEFAFRSALFSQMEAIYYFDKAGAVFVFMDGGAGFDSSVRLTRSEAKAMLGYGAGIRFPSRLGTVTLEWARNKDDGWNLGRVHLGVKTGM